MKAPSIYAAAGILVLWGIAHVVIPTRDIIRGFGPLSDRNRRILLMEWLMEGVLLIFVGVLVGTVSYFDPAMGAISVVVFRLCAAVLAVMAGISLVTGARTDILPMRLCPPIFLTAAILVLVPTLV